MNRQAVRPIWLSTFAAFAVAWCALSASAQEDSKGDRAAKQNEIERMEGMQATDTQGAMPGMTMK